MSYGNALKSIGSDARRTILEKLRAGPQSVGVIAKGLPMSRPAVSQHLKVLKDAGMIKDRAEGTRRVYYIDPHGLGELRRWLNEFWDGALESFANEVKAQSVAQSKREKK